MTVSLDYIGKCGAVLRAHSHTLRRTYTLTARNIPPFYWEIAKYTNEVVPWMTVSLDYTGEFHVLWRAHSHTARHTYTITARNIPPSYWGIVQIYKRSGRLNDSVIGFYWKMSCFVTGALTHAQKHLHINSRVESLLITGESSSDDFDSMLVCLVCLSVCLYVDKFETLSRCEFSTYQHHFLRIRFFYTKLQVYEISEV